MSSMYLDLQPFFSFLHNCLPSSRQSYPSLASLLVSSLSFFPLSSALMFPRTTCPIQFLFRFIIVCTKHLSSPTAASTSTFVFLSCQLTFSILLHHTIIIFIAISSSFPSLHYIGWCSFGLRSGWGTAERPPLMPSSGRTWRKSDFDLCVCVCKISFSSL